MGEKISQLIAMLDQLPEAQVKSLIERLFKQNPLLVLDGELYNHDLRDNFEKIVSLVRKQKPTSDDRKEARKLIQYHVYDYCMAVNNKLNLLESDMNKYVKVPL